MKKASKITDTERSKVDILHSKGYSARAKQKAYVRRQYADESFKSKANFDGWLALGIGSIKNRSIWMSKRDGAYSTAKMVSILTPEDKDKQGDWLQVTGGPKSQ